MRDHHSSESWNPVLIMGGKKLIDLVDYEKLSIRAAGHDEFWLQDRIVENPKKLNLGDLQVITREKVQSSGGRLDILLKDSTDNSM